MGTVGRGSWACGRPPPLHIALGAEGVARWGRAEPAGAGMGAARGARAPQTGPTARKTLLRLCSRWILYIFNGVYNLRRSPLSHVLRLYTWAALYPYP